MQVMSQNLDCLCRSVMRAWIPACAGMTSKRIVAVGLLAMTTSSLAREPSTLNDFSDASQWRVIASNQVSGKIRSIDDGADGKAHRIALSTKRKLNDGFMERVREYIDENYAPNPEALDPKTYKHWRDVVLTSEGGNGAVREACDLVLAALPRASTSAPVRRAPLSV